MTDTTAPDAITQADDIVTIDEIRAIFSSGTVPMEAAVAIQNATSPAALRAELREIAAHRRLAAHGAGEGLREVAEAALLTLRHARVFIGSREKMHPDGQALYDADVDALAAALSTPSTEPLGAYVGVTSAANSKYPDAADVSGGSFSFLPINQHIDFSTPPTDAGSTTREGGEGVADAPADLLSHLQRIPMTEWVWSDAERIFATLAALTTTSSPDASPDSGETSRRALVNRPRTLLEARAIGPVTLHGTWVGYEDVVTVVPSLSGGAGGWIIGNGDGTRWRCWSQGMSTWTDDREKATRYHRREDAEAVHAGDEDAWTVQPFATTSPLDSGSNDA